MLQDRVAVIANGVSLVALAVVAGILLTFNLQLSFISQRRETFSALQAWYVPFVTRDGGCRKHTTYWTGRWLAWCLSLASRNVGHKLARSDSRRL